MPAEWSNWSGSLRFRPDRIEHPASEAEVVEIVRRAAAEGRSIRPVGTGHSSSPILETPDVLVSLDRLRGLIGHYPGAHEATIRGGTTLFEAGRAFLQVGLAMPNLGDVNVQTVAGAIATGTHGSGRTLPNLAAVLVGGRLVTGTGEVREFGEAIDPEFLCVARVSLGALGIMTELRLRLLPAYRLHRREFCTGIDNCLARLDDLADANRNLDFYWYPRSDEAKIRTLNPPGQGTAAIPGARLVAEQEGWSGEVISRVRELKFDEMEFALPAEAGPPCFQAIRQRIKTHHRRTVGWRVLYRFIAADAVYLSTASGRPTVTISLHHNATLPYQAFFDDLEPVFRDFGGRPHWAKKHSLTARDLRPLYPRWDAFQAVRRRLDPNGVFLSPALRRLLEHD